MSPWWILWAAVVVALAWQFRRALRDEHDVGPDSLRLLEDTDAFLDGLLANDPELAAGFDRLRAAIRDDQQRGETT